MEVSGELFSFLIVKDCQISGDIFSDSFYFSELGSITGCSLGVSKGPKFVLKLLDVSLNSLGITFSNFMTNFFFHHLINYLLFNKKLNKNQY
jgi:hypothetical protein